jgi:hypothetical protein
VVSKAQTARDMKPIILLVILSCAVVGCTTTRTLGTDGASSFLQLNAQAGKRTATVALTDGRQIRAKYLHMAPDSTSWFDPESGRLVRIATPQVQEVRFTSRGRGALEGALIGAAIGAISGSLLLAVIYEPCTGWCVGPDFSGWAIVGATAILGLPIGAVAGTAAGSRRKYMLEAPTPALDITVSARNE